MAEARSAVWRLLNYSLATVGPIGSAGAQFVLSLLLLRRLDAVEFGAFSFLMVASQFSWGVWSALFCAPLPILMASGDASSRRVMLRGLMTANLTAAVLACLLFLTLGLRVHSSPAVALLFAGYAAVALLRWFARAYAYVTGAPLRTTVSDMVYTVVLLSGVGISYVSDGDRLTLAYASLFLAALLAMIPFGASYLAAQFLDVVPRSIAGYWSVLRQHSGWSLLGVLTTEATANAHVYIVTVVFGPAAFASVAASALLIRPINVAMNALTEFERAQMAVQISGRKFDLMAASVRFFRLVLVASWALTVAAMFAILFGTPRLVFPARYELRDLIIGAALWAGVTAVRALRTPESVLLQAGGAFRPLAMASVYSSVASVTAVLALAIRGGPLASIGGVLVGEALAAVLIWRQASRWRQMTARALALA